VNIRERDIHANYHRQLAAKDAEIAGLQGAVVTYGNTIRDQHAEIAQLLEALEQIARPGYGLQGLLEDDATDEEICRYWADGVERLKEIASAALAGSSAVASTKAKT
jgi:hypothetical protein